MPGWRRHMRHCHCRLNNTVFAPGTRETTSQAGRAEEWHCEVGKSEGRRWQVCRKILLDASVNYAKTTPSPLVVEMRVQVARLAWGQTYARSMTAPGLC